MGLRASAALAALMITIGSLASPAAGDTTASPTGSSGQWTVEPDGSVLATGGAPWYGDARALDLWEPVVGIVSTPSGRGYWLVARDSGVFTYGDATYEGNLIDALIQRDRLPPGTLHAGNVLDYLDGEIVDAIAAPEGHGYWLLGADGGVFSFGSAAFHGSLSGRLPVEWRQLATDIAPTTQGYRIEVFLYEPSALADSEGMVRGITQVYVCEGGTCAFRGQWTARVKVPGVSMAPAACPHVVRRIGSVVDGDTVQLDGVLSRLYDLETPERGEGGHDTATADLAAFLGTGATCVEFHHCDRFGRPVVTIHHRGTTASEHMQSLGWTPSVGTMSGTGSWPCTSAAPPPPPPPSDTACDPNYSPCVPLGPPDLDCVDVGRRVTVIGPADPHRLDGDGDGVGCERFG